jgi:hypothetical protein
VLTAPVAVKDCNHVFCNQPDPHGHHCPKCMMKNVHDSSLVPQPIIETAAEAWKLARPELFKRQVHEQGQDKSTPMSKSGNPQGSRPAKRARLGHSSGSSEVEEVNAASTRVTRSTSNRLSRDPIVDQSIVVDSDSEEGTSYHPASNGPTPRKSNGVTGSEDKDYRSMQGELYAPEQC